MFTNDFGESFQNEIELQGVDPGTLDYHTLHSRHIRAFPLIITFHYPDALETLVNYCYTGKL